MKSKIIAAACIKCICDEASRKKFIACSLLLGHGHASIANNKDIVILNIENLDSFFEQINQLAAYIFEQNYEVIVEQFANEVMTEKNHFLEEYKSLTIKGKWLCKKYGRPILEKLNYNFDW